MSEEAPSHSSENSSNASGSNVAKKPTDNWVPEPSSPRGNPPPPSLLRRVLPPILGGLTALPVAIGILWYGFGKDIGNAGPTVARYIPWLVPEHLRGSARWRYNPSTDSKQKQFDAPANLDAGEFGRIGGANK